MDHLPDPGLIFTRMPCTSISTWMDLLGQQQHWGCELVFPPTRTEAGPSPLGEHLRLAGPFPPTVKTACGPGDGTYYRGGSSHEGISLKEGSDLKSRMSPSFIRFLFASTTAWGWGGKRQDDKPRIKQWRSGISNPVSTSWQWSLGQMKALCMLYPQPWQRKGVKLREPSLNIHSSRSVLPS